MDTSEAHQRDTRRLQLLTINNFSFPICDIGKKKKVGLLHTFILYAQKEKVIGLGRGK